MLAVNNEILLWARETAGLTIDDAAKKLGLKDNKTITAKEKLMKLETGEIKPTKANLLKMAKAYRRPLITFYLKNPPMQGDRGQDFRTVNKDSLPQENALLDSLIRNILSRQSIIKAILEEEEAEELPFINSIKIEDDYKLVAKKIQKDITFDINTFYNHNSKEKAFTYLRNCIEDSGIFVLLVGNLGSHHTNISVEVFRGFAIADNIAPFIVINDRDAKAAWAFTALHELAHLWLGKTGISNFSTDNQIEKFCNSVAGEILLPTASMKEFNDLSHETFEIISKSIINYADKKNLSYKMVAYKLFLNNVISKREWESLDNYFYKEWLNSKNSQKSEGGPHAYTVKKHRLGNALVEIVRNALMQGTISYTKAAKVLGISNPLKVQGLLDHAPSSGGV